MRILAADDYAVLREGLRQLLNGQQDMEAGGKAEDSPEAIEKAPP